MNVITYDVYKNTVKKHDGFNPVTSEKNYSKLQFRFRDDDDWKNCTLVTASFWLSIDNIVKSDVELLSDELTATFDIPPEFSGIKGTLKVGLQGTYKEENEEVTVSTNIITLNRNTGAIITEGASQSLYEQLLALFTDYIKQIDSDFMNKINISHEEYLNAHPELTTSVQNGSITEAKFADVLKLKKASFYKNVAEMKADTSLKSGMTAVVLGYYEPNDGGMAEYYIGESGNITLDAFHLTGPANNVVEHYKAQIVIKPQMNIECFGATGDGVSDDSAVIESASSYDTQLIFKNKTYLILRSIYIDNSIRWIGNGTVIKLADSFNVNLETRSAIRINGETDIVGVNIEYQSKFAPNDGNSSVIVLKVTSGKNHVLKDVNIDITEKDGVAAEVSAVWYDFAKRTTAGETFVAGDTHNLYVSNCKISNLTTGHNTGTSCLWGTGIFDNIIVKSSDFTRNHLGDVVNFWANNEKIDNIYINNCKFNATNNVKSGASCLQFGASFLYPTIFNKINIENCLFRIGGGFGNACIGCASSEVEINVNNCEFIKSYDDSVTLPTDTNDAEYFKRLMVFDVNSYTGTSKVNAVGCKFINLKSNMYIATSFNNESQKYITYKTEYNINNSEIVSFANIYNAAKVKYDNCKISIDNPDEAVLATLYLKSTEYYINSGFVNCEINSNIRIKGNVNCHSSIFNDTTAFSPYTGNNLDLSYNIFKGLNISTASESTAESPIINELIMKDNIIKALTFKNSSTVTAVDNLGTLATSVIFVNNISNKTMLANVFK